ncbi:MAG: hypothetical protein IIT65_10150 [Lachnospiraceae bacterium]|nr:hypothetical protein [Lachnospiraceae bacterium]
MDNALSAGVFTATKKDGTLYYRTSVTHKRKHISLGSFKTESDASNAYLEGRSLLDNNDICINDYFSSKCYLKFEKWVCLINYRDNGMYFKNPIYVHKNYFDYYYDMNTIYKFDVDDLFFYSHHKIMKRNTHLFVADYGMQTNILSRYGIHSHSVPGRDYIFINGDNTDFRYKNIKVINKYKGVFKDRNQGRDVYTAKIHINGDYIIGRYKSESEAAIAYNKAVDILGEKNVSINYEKNYVEDLSPIEYASTYNMVKISKKILNYQ